MVDLAVGFRSPFLDSGLTRALGVILVIAGVPSVADLSARFALQGTGTPARVSPPQRLVVSGLYRYLRNSMYVSAIAVIFGQALLFGDWRL